ncbi:MAG TPA: M48 family metallopeptidase [Candidatus Limnocylindria bacterium]|nr:M48 family metallopeptidase [Candidatus Limnocylindria bacterium]
MKSFIGIFLLLLFTGCATQRDKLVWRVKDVVLSPYSEIMLEGPHGEIALAVPTRTIQEMFLAHTRIIRTANVQSELYIAAGDDPNAFAGPDATGRNIIGINVGMVKLVGADVSVYAALIGHEAAHLAKGHGASGKLRSNSIDLVATLVGAGLGMAGVPGGGLISGFAADVIDSVYSRDQEREADALGVDYLLANRYDPQGAIRLHELLIKSSSGFRIPFLASHPSSDERVENLRALIEAKKPKDESAAPIPPLDGAAAKQ